MRSVEEIIWFQLILLLIAVLARSFYYVVMVLVRKGDRKDLVMSSWAEFTRIGSDLCHMSFATVATALLNPASKISELVLTSKANLFKFPALFLLGYVIVYLLHKIFSRQYPFQSDFWKTLGIVSPILASWIIGYNVLLIAAGLAISAK